MNPLTFFSLVCVFYVLNYASWQFIITVVLIIFGTYAFFSYRLNAPPMSTRRKLMMATWSAPSEGVIHASLTCNADPLVTFLELKEKQGEKVTVTVALLRAIGLALRKGPGLNSSIAFGQFVPHSSFDVSCLVALDDGADLGIVKISNVDKKSMMDIQVDLKKRAEKLKRHQDKDFEASKPLLKLLPVALVEPILALTGYLSGALGVEIAPLGLRPYPFGMCMVTSVGMLGVEQAFVPFTPFARVPLLVMIGAIKQQPIVVNDATNEPRITIQSQLTFGISLDHRFVDGMEAAKISKELRRLVEQPHLLDNPDLPPADNTVRFHNSPVSKD